MKHKARDAIDYLRQSSKICFTYSGRIAQNCVEHRSQFTGRARDNFEYFRGRGLLLKRLAQLSQQARILDGNDGLSSKILHQLDLLVGKWSYLLAIDRDGAN